MALFNLGFRIFFCAASAFAFIAIALWLAIYAGHLAPVPSVAPPYWHGHEMLYGYTFAVIAGFLLTAVRNWTGLPTAQGASLAILFGFWLIARLAWFFPDYQLLTALLGDLLFNLALLINLAVPILHKRQWRQLGILSKLALLGTGNVLFYLSALGLISDITPLTLYAALYLIIALILTIARRVFPFFIQNGVDVPITITSPRWIDLSSLFGLLAFFINELFIHHAWARIGLATLLAVITMVRIAYWYTPEIWRHPLLWGLFAGLAAINLGFVLFALQAIMTIPDWLPLHAFAFGGIGIMTLAMMARVSLGHTGRNLRTPPRIVGIALLLLCVGVLLRCVGPLLAFSAYPLWVSMAGVCWIIAFLGFTLNYLPIWTQPRVDGKPG